ncbi:MAG: endopeptidase La [Lachnospiraceae bacterium]|nr:endopeptidase La [Lachnospiraceae bacterium]
MITIPAYNMLFLPDVTFYLKMEFFEKYNIDYKNIKIGEEVLLTTIKDDKSIVDLTPEDFNPIGVVAGIINVDNEGNVQLTTKGRVDVTNIEIDGEKVTADVKERKDIEDITEAEVKDKFIKLRKALIKFIQGFQWGIWGRNYILHMKSIYEMACSLGSYIDFDSEDRYAIVATDSKKKRCELIEKVIYEFIEMSKVNAEAESAQQEDHEQLYRESAIKKQIEILQNELDEMHPENVSDVRKFEKLIAESGMNEVAKKEAEKVLNRMKQEGKDSHEYGMLYDYLDFVTTLSWKPKEGEDIDLKNAENILDEDHYGLKKVKERIIQQLAVMSLTKKQSGSILLFVGAPGTGKTSIGQSIARALGRKYVRISLGGIRDEAEIRGHRRTYVGAMPGRIMEGMKQSGVSNPVMVLDEVDKLVKDYGGDPASALLEVLDPEQNGTFTDHYMNVPYDLSDVLFVCTANTLDTIPEPLLNRMEVIQFPGYSALEKFYIAKKHLIPKALKNTGIKSSTLKISDAAIRRIISDYTMESGVRGLKKEIDILCRGVAVDLVKGEATKISVGEKNLVKYIGRKKTFHDVVKKDKVPGIVTGLAWTAAGGEILFVETKLMKGSGDIIITGQLGDVMKESAKIALTMIKSMYPEVTDILKENDLHIHVPEGAVPKDGPSAGITLITALASLFTGKYVDSTVAMTGEVSLRGGVMPIGGLPEKLMAAGRAGVKKVFIPKDNVEDLEDVATEVKEKLEIVPVAKIKDVLKDLGLK